VYAEDTSTIYRELDEKLQGRNKDRRKVGNNTYAERRDDGSIAIRLHATDIVTVSPTGLLILESGGWRTVTTKDRINQYLPAGYSLYVNRGIWYLQCPNGDTLNYADGMTIDYDNTPRGYALPDPIGDKILRKQISGYAKLCAEAVPLSLPNGGDCWYCYLRGEDGRTMGEQFKDRSHFLDHFREKYVVPSLVWRAMEVCGYDPKRNIQFAMVFKVDGDMQAFRNGYADLAQSTVRKCVRRYLMKQFGYQA
jgi:hypothetical protein